MEIITRQPLAVRIGIAAAALVAVLAIVYLAMNGTASAVTVTSSRSTAEISDAKLKLDQAKVPATIQRDGDAWKITVPASAKQQAEAALGIDTKAGAAGRPTCTKPGTFPSTSQTDDYRVCRAEQDIYDQLVSQHGVQNARVVLTEQDSGSLTGADKVASASITVFLEPNATVSGQDLATLAAASHSGLDTQRIVIRDGGDGHTMWSLGQTAASGASGGCNLGSASSDLMSKQQAVSACYTQELMDRFSDIVGGRANIKIATSVTLNAAAQQSSAKEITQGAMLKTTLPGTGSASDHTSEFAPNEKTTSTTTDPGAAVDRLSISVLLDTPHVSAAQESAIRQALVNYVNVDRGDSVSVQRTTFGSGTGSSASTMPGMSHGANAAPAADATGGGAGASSSSAGNPAFATSSGGGVSTSMVVTGGLLLLVLLGIVGLLLRNGNRMSKERQVFENEFRRENQMFNNFAQQNADELARDLEALLGATPSRN